MLAGQAHYTVTLEDSERGFAHDSTITVMDREGRVLGTRKEGSLNDKLQTACDLILGDWSMR